jgi:hypothetical protein
MPASRVEPPRAEVVLHAKLEPARVAEQRASGSEAGLDHAVDALRLVERRRIEVLVIEPIEEISRHPQTSPEEIGEAFAQPQVQVAVGPTQA